MTTENTQPIKKNNVTVVIPNYNGEKYLAGCLKSLHECEVDFEFDICVIDNGSKDKSIEILKEDKKVKTIFLEENTGFCHAVNLGIEQAAGEYVILLNNDTKVYPGFVKSLYKAIKADTRIFSVSAAMLMWDNDKLLDDAGDRTNILGYSYSRGKGKPKTEYDTAVSIFSACGGAAIYRKSIFDKIGKFDERHFAYLEDVDVGFRALIYGYKNMYEPEAMVLHYGSASTGSRYNAWKANMAAANNLYMLFKNLPLIMLLINLPFILLGFLIKFLFYLTKGMGREYVKGLGKGLKKSFCREGFSKKVPFKVGNTWNLIKIEFALIINTFRSLNKS